MSLPQGSTQNRADPVSVSIVEEPIESYLTYDQVTLCAEPNCPVCRAQRRDAGEKSRHHHHKQHRHKKHQTNFWNNLLPRVQSSSSTVSVHSIELSEPRVASTVTKQTENEGFKRDAWTTNDDDDDDDEVVCCRAYNGCRCPCWCCTILIILFVIMIIILIVLLATLL